MTTSARLHRAAPLAASGTVVTTLVTCLVIAKINHVYTGGLAWPYFSDLGRDPPGYYVFCVGLSSTAVLLCATWWFNYQFQRSALGGSFQTPRHVKWMITVCMLLGIISTIGLPVLAFCSNSSYPTEHDMAACWFFLLETITVLFNTYVSFRILKGSRSLDSGADPSNISAPTLEPVISATLGFKRTLTIQVVFATLLLVAFLLYQPIGRAIAEPSKLLTIEECLERDLGEKYCTVDMKYNSTETKLWNHENNLAVTQMRAVAQLVCILTLVGYSVSFLTHKSDTADVQQKGTALAKERTQATRAI